MRELDSRKSVVYSVLRTEIRITEKIIGSTLNFTVLHYFWNIRRIRLPNLGHIPTHSTEYGVNFHVTEYVFQMMIEIT